MTTQPELPLTDPAAPPRAGTQNAEILRHMQQFGSITPLEALKCHGCMRLAARIHDLRAAGYQIRATDLHDGHGKTFKTYSLA